MQQFLTSVWRYYRDKSLILKMTSGFVLGLIVAAIFGEKAEVLMPLGDIFLRLLQMIIVPIAMLTLIDAVGNTESSQIARIVPKAFGFYILTTIAAVVIGLVLTILLRQAGLPLNVVALVAGVDVILGMGCTMTNVTGDLVGAHIIDKNEA
jgi:Na+/H+-dicarboxylate symporter